MEENELIKNDNLIEESFNNFNLKIKDGYNQETHKSLLLLIESLEKENDYLRIIDTINENIDKVNDDKYKLDIINKKISALLKIEAFNDLLVALDYKEKLESLNIVEKANVLFYKAIAFEALDEINLSIKALESITDNISKYSLVNKYLKLSLLYLKVGKSEDAKKAYDYATLIDPSHNNDMFILVESDLFYESKKYEEALDSYMSFFLKSSNKYKYLDRYIKISIKLNRLDDAYNFYKEYINKNSIKFSTINKYAFLKSVKELLLLMDKKDELNEILYELEELKPTYSKKEENDKLRIIEEISKNLSMPLTKFDKNKNIVNKFFKYVDILKKDILCYVEKRGNSYFYSKYNFKELKEKEIFKSSIDECEHSSFFYANEDTIFDYYLNDKLEVINSIVKIYRIKNEYKDYGFFFVSYNDSLDDLYSILRNSILEVLNRLDTLITQSNIKEALLSTVSSVDCGFLSITSNRVELLSNKAKEILGIKEDVISFDIFKSLFIDDIYPDSFINKKELKIKKISDDEIKIIKFESTLYKDVIYSIFKDYTLKEKDELLINNYFIHSSLKFYNENDLYKEIENNDSSYSILGLTLNLISSGDSLDSRNSILNNLYNFLIDLIPDSKLYYLNENHFIILSHQIDKRVLDSYYERINESIHKMYKYSYSLRDNKVIGFFTKSLKGKSVNLVKDIIEYGFFYSSIKNEFIPLDNEEKRDYSLFKTYNKLIENDIINNNFNTKYYPIISEEDSNIHYFLVNYSFMYDLSFDVLNRIILSNSLETKLDLLLIEKVFKEIKEFNKEIKYIIPIHKESVTNSNFIKAVSKLYKDYQISDNTITFRVDSLDIIGYRKGLESIKNIKIDLALNYKDINDTSDFNIAKIIFFNINTMEPFIKNIVYGIRDILKLEVVLIESKPMKNTYQLNSKFGYYDKEKMKKF